MYSNTMHTSPVGCVKAATDILGDKWTPHILRHFSNTDTVRFCQVQDNVTGINPRTLSSRLARLEQQGIIQKVPTTSENRCEYSLTEKGATLLPILKDMEVWGTQFASSQQSLSQSAV